MEKILNDKVVEEILKIRLPISDNYSECSFILPNGKFVNLQDHYEAYNFLVIEDLVPCMPDAELLLSDLGYIRYSQWARYMTLPHKPLTKEQYEKVEEVLLKFANISDEVTIQLQDEPRFYCKMELNDIPHIIKRMKQYYTTCKFRG